MNNNILNCFRHMENFENQLFSSAIDFPHNLLMLGMLLSSKPSNVLELGIGTGYVTKTILHGLKYNEKGSLISVDSLKDFEKVPDVFEEIKLMGGKIIISSEEHFIKSQSEHTFDFLVSDADHKNSINWIDKTISIIKPNSPMFFHDTNSHPNLKHLEEKLKNKGIYCVHFKESSLPSERCSRGWLMAFT